MTVNDRCVDPAASFGSYIGPSRWTRSVDDSSRSMIRRMTTPASKTAAGSVGTVDTQFLDLPQPLQLDCGRTLHPVRIAYETYGTLSPARDNVILVCHALSGDAHAAGFATTPADGEHAGRLPRRRARRRLAAAASAGGTA